MKNTTVVIMESTIVESMEITINMLPGSAITGRISDPYTA